MTDANGRAELAIDQIDGSVRVDITEVVEPLFTLAGASCEVTADDQVAVAAVGDTRGSVDIAGAAINDIVINAGETVTCTFVNESGDVEQATGTPRVTPPPTSTLPVSGTPGGDTWRIALLAIAALLAMVLLLTPASPAMARRRR